MHISDTAHPSDDEIDLLDLLVVLVENIKLLILLPLLAAGIGLALAFALPSTFASTSILSPNKAGLNFSGQVLASLMKSADVLDTVALEAGIRPDASAATRLRSIEKRVQVSVGKQDSLVTLVTEGETPEQAQKLNALLWKHVLPHTQPRGAELQRLQEQLDAEQERLASGLALEKNTTQTLQNGATSESLTRLYGELLSSNSSRIRSIATLKSQIEGLTVENLAQQPTLPELAIGRVRIFV